LQRAGVAVPDAFAGRPFAVVRDDHALDQTRELESALIHASAIRGPFLRATIFGASALALICVLLVASGRGRGGRARGFPVTWRGFLDVGLVAVVAIPAALILEPLSGTASTPASAAVVFGGAIAVALTLRM